MSLEQQENVRFARTIRRYPCLYDYTSKGYLSRSETESAWREISAEFNAPIRDCKLRWKNIRTVYRRHLFGSVGPAPKKDYYLSKELRFLLPLMRVTKKNQDYSMDLEDEEHINVMVEMEPDDTESDDPAASRSASESQFFGHGFQEPTLTESKQPELKSDFIRRHKSLETTATTDGRKPSYNRDTASGSEFGYGTTYIQDDLTAVSDELYLLSLKDDMRQMNPTQKRKFKRRIYDIIDEVMAHDRSPTIRAEAEHSNSTAAESFVKVENECITDD